MLSITDLYKEVHWFNFPNLKTKPHSNQHYSIKKSNTSNKQNNTYYYLYVE